MSQNGLITCYQYDKQGYFKGTVAVQVLEGAALMPPNCVKEAPALQDGYWYKINDADVWIAEAKPKSAADCLDIVVAHEDNSARAVELKKLMQSFCEKDSEHYRVKRDENLAWTVESIPEKTFDELQSEKLKQVSEEAGKYDQYKCDTMYVTSSVDAVKINADARSQNNIRALIEHYTEEVTFKTYDNDYVVLNKEQLETMLAECIKNGESLYQQKWQLQQAVASATSKEELASIKIEFSMLDFSQS